MKGCAYEVLSLLALRGWFLHPTSIANNSPDYLLMHVPFRCSGTTVNNGRQPGNGNASGSFQLTTKVGRFQLEGAGGCLWLLPAPTWSKS